MNRPKNPEKHLPNDPSKAGKFASLPVLYGPSSRYKIQAVHTRFDDVQWLVFDADRRDENGRSTIIAQEPTFEKAQAALFDAA